MPNPFFVGFELLEIFLFLLCLRHARRAGSAAIWRLLAGIIYGILLELATIRQLHIYQYGQFTLMVLDVPLAVAVMWGTLLYGVRLLSDATTLPEWARPMLDALLAIAIDLIMDPIAIRLGMWEWKPGLPMQYFGVPYGNFWGWFWAVYPFSAGLRLLENRPSWVGRWLAPGSAILIGLLGVVSGNAIMLHWVPDALRTITVAALLLAALALVLMLRPHLIQPPVLLAGQVSLITQGYFLIAGLTSGALFQLPVLLAMSLLTFGISFYVYQARGWWRPVR